MEQNNKEKKIWFRRKLYGWGWTPCSWQGWLVVFVWLIFFLFFISEIEESSFNYFLFVFLSVLLLLWVCYKKGEKPKWQWGKRRED